MAAPITSPRFCSDTACEYSTRGNQRLSRMEAAGQVMASASPNGIRNRTQAPNEAAVVDSTRITHQDQSPSR